VSRSFFVRAFLVVALASGFAPAAVHAQDGGGGGGGGGRRGGGMMNITEQLKTALDLTDDQVKKVQAIEDDMRAKMREMFQGGDRSQMQEQMTAAMEKVKTDVKAILTKEQEPKFDEWVKGMEERRNQFGRGGPGGGGDPKAREKRQYDEAEKALTLSPEEKSAVMPLVKKLIEARSEARQAADKNRQDLVALLKAKPGTTDAEKTEITAKLAEFRKAREADTAKVKAAADAIKEVLTVENECKLVSIGILD
jgi:Spy/CpxP family protein refolding chaperone